MLALPAAALSSIRLQEPPLVYGSGGGRDARPPGAVPPKSEPFRLSSPMEAHPQPDRSRVGPHPPPFRKLIRPMLWFDPFLTPFRSRPRSRPSRARPSRIEPGLRLRLASSPPPGSFQPGRPSTCQTHESRVHAAPPHEMPTRRRPNGSPRSSFPQAPVGVNLKNEKTPPGTRQRSKLWHCAHPPRQGMLLL